MSERKEKYVRGLEGRLGVLEGRVDKLAAELQAQRRFEDCLAAVRQKMEVEERAQCSRKRARKRQPEQWARMLFVLCLALGLLGLLTVRVGGQETGGREKREGIRERVAAEVPLTVAVPALNVVENARISHYCACALCCGKEDGITATGAKAMAGVTVAVDPVVIPLGSWVRVGDAWYIAQDTGVVGGAVDVFVSDHQEALKLGVRRETVWWTAMDD